MSDGVLINQGIGTTIATKDRGAGGHEQIVISGQWTTRVQVTPVISTSPAYTAGDCIGGLMDIAAAARFSGGSGRLKAVTLLDKTQAQRAAIDLVFFDRSVTVQGDNAAFAVSDADMANCLGIVSIATADYNTAWAGTPLNSFATHLVSPELPFVVNATDLFCQAVSRGTPTYTSTSDLIFSFLLGQD